jgi:hypothetical protein
MKDMSGRPIYILKSTFNIELSEFLLSTFIHNLTAHNYMIQFSKLKYISHNSHILFMLQR